MSDFLRDPTFRGKFLLDSLVWPPLTLHKLRKLTGKESGDGTRHQYRPSDVRKLKLAMYKIDEASRTPALPPVINCRMAKGGTGKTTVCANISTAFAFMGYKVLVIDADPQSSITNLLGVDAANEAIVHVGDLMVEAANSKGPADINRAVRHIFPDGMLDLIPADITLTNTDGWLMSQMQRETVFDRLIRGNPEFFAQYDVIVIDSAPGTSLLSLNMMVASRTQLAVVWLDRENLKALPILVSNVAEINGAYPGNASDIEVVANGLNTVYKHSKEALSILIESYPHALNENVLTQVSAFNRQQSLPGGESKGALIEQDPANVGSKAMLDLAKSLLHRYQITLAGYDESIPTTRRTQPDAA